MFTPMLIVAAALGQLSVQDQLDGTEIGDATQYIAFNSGGKYEAERTDAKGKTTARGSWAVKGDTLEVKVASCKGPACAELGKGYQAKIELVAERAMTVKSTMDKGPLSSGSYYCRFQGCEKRTGVLLQANAAKPAVMKYLVDFLIDKNRTRDVTVVWWGKKGALPQPKSSITWCQREAERGRKGAELVANDLAELPWFGAVKAAPGASECLYDVLVMVGDDVVVPKKQR